MKCCTGLLPTFSYAAAGALDEGTDTADCISCHVAHHAYTSRQVAGGCVLKVVGYEGHGCGLCEVDGNESTSKDRGCKEGQVVNRDADSKNDYTKGPRLLSWKLVLHCTTFVTCMENMIWGTTAALGLAARRENGR